MILLIFFLFAVFVALGAGFLAALSDFRGMVIPNALSVVIAAAFFAAYAGLWLSGRDDVFMPLVPHLLSALVVFAVTLAMFMLGGIGAGDSKLASAFAFWTGLEGLMAFLFYMALAGGVLGLVALALRRWKPVRGSREGGWIARVQAGENGVPYGAAIFAGALASFVKLGYLGPEVLSSFLLP